MTELQASILITLTGDGVALLWAIAKAVEKIERHNASIAHLLRHALYGENDDSEVKRIRSIADKMLQWEAEKRPRL